MGIFGSGIDEKIDDVLGTKLADEALEDQTEVEAEVPASIYKELTEIPKMVGLVAPVVADPQHDLETITPLLGLLKSVETRMVYTCPVCHDEQRYAMKELDLDEDHMCGECEHEGIIGDFYDGPSNHLFIVTTTRHISDDEVGMLLYGNTTERSHTRSRDRDRLKAYFAMLHGHEAPVQHERAIACAPEIMHRHHCDTDCQRRDCRCFGSVNGSMLGMLKTMPVQDTMDDDDEEEFDDEYDEDNMG